MVGRQREAGRQAGGRKTTLQRASERRTPTPRRRSHLKLEMYSTCTVRRRFGSITEDALGLTGYPGPLCFAPVILVSQDVRCYRLFSFCGLPDVHMDKSGRIACLVAADFVSAQGVSSLPTSLGTIESGLNSKDCSQSHLLARRE